MQNKNRKSGYTIIETMIAVSLFLIIIMAGMGALLNANLLHGKSQNMRSIMDNLSFIMEDISKNLRTGSNYRCISGEGDLSPSDVIIPKSGELCWGVAFEHQDGDLNDSEDQWVYFIDVSGKIWKSTEGPYDILPDEPFTKYVQLNSEEVVIDTGITTSSKFSVLGAEPSPEASQPFLNIKLVGNIIYKNITTPFSLQTSISQRLIDN